MTIVQFSAYREFDRARVAANDASMALMLAGAFADRELARQPATDLRLPRLFPEISDVARLDVSVDRARRLLAESDRYLAYMAIPFVLSVHATYVADLLEMLAADGFDIGERDPNERALADLHSDVMHHCRGSLTRDEVDDYDHYLSLFQFVRVIRTRLVHSGRPRGIECGRSGMRLLPLHELTGNGSQEGRSARSAESHWSSAAVKWSWRCRFRSASPSI